MWIFELYRVKYPHKPFEKEYQWMLQQFFKMKNK